MRLPFALTPARVARAGFPALALMLACVTRVQAWPTSPLQHADVCTAVDTQFQPRAVSDGGCGVIVAWTDLRGGGAGRDVYVQRLDASGVPVWATDGLAVGAEARQQYDPAIVSDGAGGAIVAWLDGRAGLPTADLALQRVDASGAALWTANGVLLGAVTAHNGLLDARLPVMVSDGAGGAILAWEDYAGPTADIRVQRVNALGIPTWGAGGVLVCSAAQDQFGPTLARDGAGGAIVAWQDFRLLGTANLFAQRVSAVGAPLWLPDGAPVCTVPSEEADPQAVSDGTGGAIVAWLDDRSGWAVYAQRLNPAGAGLWAINGVALTTGGPSKGELHATVDGLGGAVVAWRAQGAGPGAESIVAQRLSLAGNALWAAAGVDVSTAPYSVMPHLVPDLLGGAIVAFVHAGTGDIAANRLTAGGALGGECGAYRDFGDAPEGITAYPSGTIGRFPSCLSVVPPGTQESAGCAPRSTPPGSAARHVLHLRACGVANPVAFWLGQSVDSELDAKVNATLPEGTPSACDPAVVTDCWGAAQGWGFGQDECVGDGDSGLMAPAPFAACDTARIWFTAHNCQPVNARAYLNVLVDWNHDGDWNNAVNCGPLLPLCSWEWAVKNELVALPPGTTLQSSPVFRIGSQPGLAWMRVTLSPEPASDDFPWRGQVFTGGETEDYLATVAATSAAPAEVAGGVRLEAPSPNPASDVTTLEFVLPRAAAVSLAVYDLCGRRVAELARGFHAAGRHRVRWNVREGALAPGVRMVRLRAGGAEVVQRAIVVR